MLQKFQCPAMAPTNRQDARRAYWALVGKSGVRCEDRGTVADSMVSVEGVEGFKVTRQG